MRRQPRRSAGQVTLDDIYDAIWTLTDELDEQKAQAAERIDTLDERMNLRDRAFVELEKRVSQLERRDTERCPSPEADA